MDTERVKRRIQEIVTEDPELIVAMKTKYVTEDLWEYCIEQNVELFQYCRKPSARIVYKALSINGMMIQYVDPTIYDKQTYQSFCQTAVSTTPKSIVAIPKEFVTAKLKAYAYAKDPELLLSEKKLTAEMVEMMVLYNPSLIQYVQDPPDELVMKVLEKEPKAIVLVNPISDRVKEFYEERFPEYASMLYFG